MSQHFAPPPPAVPDAIISSPAPHILLVILNRPTALNAITRAGHRALDRLWSWFEQEPSLRVAVFTGKGRAFCAGADLKEWNEANKNNDMERQNRNGFGGLSNRRGRKPIIAAVNGICMGGGMEMVINCDMVFAGEKAIFGLPEVKIGVVAVAGALPRLARLVGRTRATEMALTGRTYTAQTMAEWGIVNRVYPSAVNVVDKAVKWAAEIANNSPDSVIVSRQGLLGGWDGEDPVESTNRIERSVYEKMNGEYNMKEGVTSFIEKRKAVWKDSKL